MFAGQIEQILAAGWQIISDESLMRGLDDLDTLPDRAAVLTFDDGYRSMVSEALPVLRQYDVPGILFVPTDYIGGTNTFEPEGWAPREPICNWDDLRALMRAGVAVQSHGARHARWSDLTRSEKEHDAAHAKLCLESRLTAPVELFSFPYGDSGGDPGETEWILRETGYRAACLYDGNVNVITGPGDERRYHLSRLQMGPDTNLELVLSEAAPGS
jgi:peptidoglycan/xylan/chitin deacetylase (PgdA/CDA1 family)